VQWLHAQRAAGKANTGSTVPYACTERETREALALTYGMITMIDEAVGAIVKALDEQGLRENTVIVFTTDHGDYLGDHGLMLKGPIHYRSLIQTPLVWCDPTQPSMQGRRSDALCSTLDIARTLLDRACLQPANGMQGQSLLPVLEGRAQGHAQAVLIEDEVQRTFLGFQEPPRVRTLVTSGQRMTVYLGADWGELYDLAEDPLELCNLWSDPSALQVRTSLLSELALQMIAHTDRSPRPTHVA
jgi:arylsulfatase A-like enzyme